MSVTLELPPSSAERRGVVAVILREDRFLAIRRSRHVVAPGAVCFPGGGIEPGESEPEALVRELREELALEIRPRARVWRSVTPWGVALSWWRCDAPWPEQAAPHPDEVESYHWLSLDELVVLPELLASNLAFFDAWRRGEVSWDA